MPAGRVLRGQQDTPSFSAGVKVVNVLATVRDTHGQIVKTLNKDDFLLEEEGRAQTIRYFARETDLPLTLGLLVDTSMSQRRVLGEERNASSHFVDQVLREGKDEAFLIHFDFDVELLQDLTSSRARLKSTLAQLETPERPQLNRRDSSAPRSRRRGGTSLYDAVLLASDELMKKQSGRKALVLLSDGVDNGSKVTINDAVESAQRADTLVYSILFADQEAYGQRGFGGGPRMGGRRGGPPMRMPPQQRPDGKKILERLSRETGGGFFEVSRKQPIDKIYDRIQEELRNQYNLGYTPDKLDSGPGYRKIHLAARQKGLSVQARDGYYLNR